ncbi:MAG: DUF1178 family protein [Xanthobacteraceae bacterium]|nr:DUF1178 family protein [Xanthobacteraceae bacterium]
MIRYSLRCECGHAFDSWFKSSDAFDSQQKRKLVNCPACDSAQVEKAIMAPRLARKGNKRAGPEPAKPAATVEQQQTPLVMAPHERELVAKLRELREHVTKTAENVGDKFPDEARKMHYGDIDHRPIYGEATSDEARSLIEEGVDVLPLPVLPDDRN